MPFGYCRQILRVDLSTGKIEISSPGENWYRTYLGGGALASALLLRELPPGINPLGPENILVFATSVIVGAPSPGLVRFTTAAKSPLTGAYGEAEAGGFWGPELKLAGFDAIVLTGQAANPVYLWIHDGTAELREATHLWGNSTGQVQEAIRHELSDKWIRVAQIGPAGERQVRFANIVNNLHHFNGRTGMGAVMGSKRLRAIAVRGRVKPALARPAQVREIAQRFMATPHPLTALGTPLLVNALNKSGLLPTRNFIDSVCVGAEELSGEHMKDTILQGTEGCYACGVRCKRIVRVEGAVEVDPTYGGPEYEALGALGALCGVTDLTLVAKANEICNANGCDVMSAGAAIAFAMECFEHGILTESDTDGLELRFGNGAAMLALVERIVHRQGLGDILAEGVARAAKHFGRGAEEFALHVKAQELPAHEPRGKVSVGLGYAVSPTGADHLEAAHDSSYRAPGPFLDNAKPLGLLEPLDPLDLSADKVRAFVYLQHAWSLFNSLGICNFTGFPGYAYSTEDVTNLVQAITGWNISLWELLKAGERATTMARVFNVREGLTRRDDRLPQRLFEPLPSGPLKGATISRDEFEAALSTYYAQMGWDSDTGVPTRGKLLELNLGWTM